ncbi:MAG: SpoIID/LytB domain-containing protein [Patescibacteria group bacterium]
MKKQKQKSFLRETSWLLLVFLVVIIASFTLNKVGHYLENNQLILPANASSYENNISNKYKAELISKSYKIININPGGRLTFEAKFKNTGTETWYNNSKNFLALNVTNPTGRNSNFRDVFWPAYYRPSKMQTSVVKPGETGIFRFALTAPKVVGEYSEKFGLVAEHLTWISGGDLEIVMRVGNPLPHFSAKLVAQSNKEINIEPGKAFTAWVEFKNTGSQTWYPNGNHFVALNINKPIGRTSSFRHSLWPTAYRPTIMKGVPVKTGEKVRFTFALQAPDTLGSYTENFGLVAENLTWIKSGGLKIKINVTNGVQPVHETLGEPDIRVGLYPTTAGVSVSGSGDYEVRDTNNTLIGSFAKDSIITLKYENNSYSLVTAHETIISNLPLRAIPKSTDTIMEITNYEHRPEWNTSLNDNRFRGIIEIHYASATNKLWVINELPLESYLRGIAEASNDNDPDYLKALLTAARTYAIYHYQTGTKHADENFTIDAVNDQVYRGYGLETRSPNITQAIIDTEGVMVTYENEIVVTPYFSQTDGRTRSWEEVWSGGPYNWLVSVDDPGCNGRTLLGHGVGLSAYGARSMAENGSLYEDILKHYYRGTELIKQY